MDDDRLSELPDSLILAILSLLDMRDVVMTTLLSKQWKNRWTTVPCLRFRFRSPFSSDLLVESSKFVSGAVAQWKGAKILEFTLFLSVDNPLIPSTDIDSWLLFAIEKQVEKLTVGFEYETAVAYFIPQCLYSCSSITKLSLYFCSLKIERNVQWNQLKRLEIRNPEGLSDDAMNQILLGAPLLEELLFWSLKISENFNIRSTSLKMLEIGRYRYHGDFSTLVEAELRIWAPNLLSLVISASVCGSFLLYVPSLTTATLSFQDNSITREDMPPLEMFHQVFHSICYVQNVSLSHWSVQFLVDMKENDMPVQFPNAEFLELEFCDCPILDVFVVLDMFPKLKTLIVYQGETGNSFASAMMTFPSPSLLHLKTFEATLSTRDPSIIPAMEIILENDPILERVVIQLRQHSLFAPEEAEELLRMVTYSPIADANIFLDF